MASDTHLMSVKHFTNGSKGYSAAPVAVCYIYLSASSAILLSVVLLNLTAHFCLVNIRQALDKNLPIYYGSEKAQSVQAIPQYAIVLGAKTIFRSKSLNFQKQNFRLNAGPFIVLLLDYIKSKLVITMGEQNSGRLYGSG